MAIYKPSLLDKFKDFVNGLKSNWDQYEDHVADFESHLAESAAKHIYSSGSNSDGEYIMFDDGMAICTRTDTFDTTITGEQTYTYPIPLTSVFYVAMSGGGVGQTSATYRAIATAYIRPSGAAGAWGVRTTELGDSAAAPVKLFAIGQWK